MNSFFGLTIDPLSLWGKLLVLLLAVLCGGVIGYERQYRGNAAGLRTHILVCLGSNLLTLTAVEMVSRQANGDPTRMTGQIVSGIGFLGAGAILRDGMTVHGLTTAASIWVTAGIGITMGASPHLGELAVLATFIVLATLVLLGSLEKRLKIAPQPRTLTIDIAKGEECKKRLLSLLNMQSITVLSVEVENREKKGKADYSRMCIQMELPARFVRSDFMILLSQEPDISFYGLE